MGRLEYDTGAFSFFLLAIWLAGLIPLTYSAIQAYRDAVKDSKGSAASVAPTYAAYESVFVKRLLDKKRDQAANERVVARSSAVRRLALVAVGWAVFAAYLLSRESGADIQKFDPFEILGISSSATEIEIKKAYKKLSLLYHPDRQVGKDKSEQAIAETRFIMLAKAYESLTDPIARENFQKYGNPDGRQALEMSIGLPAWLLEKDNQGWVIATYLLLSIVVFPTSVMLITSNAAQSGGGLPKRLFPDTEEIFRFSVQAQFIRGFNSFVEAFALAAEFRSLVYRSEEEKKAVLDLRSAMVREGKYSPKPTPLAMAVYRQQPSIKSSEGNEKALVLVWAHLHRLHDQLSAELQDDLEFILSRSPILCRALIQHARVTCHVQALTTAIFFQQHLYQAVAPGTPFLAALPHVPTEDVEYLVKKLARRVNARTSQKPLIDEWLSKSKVAGKVISFLDDDEKAQEAIARVVEVLPMKDMTVQIGTIAEVKSNNANKTKDPRDNEYIFEDKSASGDFIRVVCDLNELNDKRLNSRTTRSGKARIAHTPFMPVEVPEEWYVILLGGPSPRDMQHVPKGEMKVTAFTTLEDDGQSKLRADMQFLTVFNGNDWMGSADWPANGKDRNGNDEDYALGLIALPSSYLELRVMRNLALHLVDASKVKKYVAHEEDERLRHEPASLMEMLQPPTQNEVDSDFEDDGDRARRANDNKDQDEDTEDVE